MSYSTTRNTYFDDVPIAENIYLMEDPHRDPYMPSEVTQKELKGYYVYSMACLPFQSILSNLILPILLDGWIIKLGMKIIKENEEARNEGDTDGLLAQCSFQSNENCSLKFGNKIMNSTLFTLIFYSIILLFQIIMSLWLGALADYGYYRKFLLLLLGTFVSIISILILSISNVEKLFYFGIVLIALSKIFYATIAVYRYGYIHTLTQHHPRTKRASHILPNSPTIYFQVLEKVANNLSTKDLVFGHLGTLLSGSLCLITVYYQANFFGLRLCCMIIGSWYLMLIIISSRYLPNRVFRPAPREYSTSQFLIYRIFQSLFYIWKLRRIYLVCCNVFLVHLLLYSFKLLSIVIYNNDSNTNTNSTLFQLIFLILLSSLGSIIGLIAFNWSMSYFKIRTKKALLVFHLFYMLIPISLFLIFNFNTNTTNLTKVLNNSNNFSLFNNLDNNKDSTSHPILTFENWPIYLYNFMEGMIISNLESLFRVYFLAYLPSSREHEFFAHYHNYQTLGFTLAPIVSLVILILLPSFKYILLVPLGILLFSMLSIYLLNEEKAKRNNNEFIKGTR
ncbi:hypothetical protein K502DRAFT_347290 [Neoconidiobolus thromboides FSU 785]|nr:hypothetical protein K502DRAFT_347290 [Neoconidiobolus thromboides FSU 785]